MHVPAHYTYDTYWIYPTQNFLEYKVHMHLTRGTRALTARYTCTNCNAPTYIASPPNTDVRLSGMAPVVRSDVAVSDQDV